MCRLRPGAGAGQRAPGAPGGSRATKERQDAVKAFDGDALLVLGSANSSNTRRLCEVARCRTFRAGTLEDVRQLDFTGVKRLGVTSGASTPEDFFHAVIRELEGK